MAVLDNKIMKKKIIVKNTLPTAIIVSSVVLAISFYMVQSNKQQFIERQQKIKNEQEEKEYHAKRKADCLNIFKTEDAKWNNVTGWSYYDFWEKCYIEYEDADPKSDAECDESFPVPLGDFANDFDNETKKEFTFLYIHLNSLCKSGKFVKQK